MSALGSLVQKGLVAPDWAEALAPVDGQVGAMGEFLRAEVQAGQTYLPDGDHILRAFSRPLADVKVLVVGQDPYPTPGHAVGLSFSVAPDVRPLPKSLVNIYKELVDDLGCPPPSNGDLTPWFEQGVMLLNRCLTVGPVRRRRTAAAAGRRSPSAPSRRWPVAAARWWPCSGAVTPRG